MALIDQGLDFRPARRVLQVRAQRDLEERWPLNRTALFVFGVSVVLWVSVLTLLAAIFL